MNYQINDIKLDAEIEIPNQSGWLVSERDFFLILIRVILMEMSEKWGSKRQYLDMIMEIEMYALW